MNTLVILPCIPIVSDSGRVLMDSKAMQGLVLYARYWGGPVRCIGRKGRLSPGPYTRWYEASELPCEVVTVPEGSTGQGISEHLRDAAVVLGAADSHLDFDLPRVAQAPAVLGIEYTFRTRAQIAQLESRNWLVALRRLLWLAMVEPGRRRALREAAAVQVNGLPARNAFAPLNSDTFLFFDTRLGDHEFVSEQQRDAKRAVVLERKPLRLAFSGRLERMKGAQHLIPVFKRFLELSPGRGTLDIYGAGSQLEPMRAAAVEAGIADAVTFHGAVDFFSVLIPALKERTDVFLCCHPQGDPSCTYLETLGCGVPIVGFRNQAFRGILSLGECGVGVSIGDIDGMARALHEIDSDRHHLMQLIDGAATVAQPRLFEHVFAERVAHLRSVADRHHAAAAGEPLKTAN